MASGKSTVGSRVAATIGWPFIDTGTMYRALTWLALQRGIAAADAPALSELAAGTTMRVAPPPPCSREYASVTVDGADATPYLRTPDVEQNVSAVAALPDVRRRLVSLQRQLVHHSPVVMAGRDIGTVVLPEAALKVYLEASAEERATRRTAELARRGTPRPPSDVLAETLARDALDSGRADSPLRPAADAVILQTGSRSEDEVVAQVLELARRVFGL